jgi:ActR/RegA family two-component response regulator
MGDNAKSYRGRKIIILSRDAAFAHCTHDDHSADQYYCLRVTSPYEAAAELLEQPPMALVIDLRRLTPSDLPLIEMARQLDLEVLAVGVLPLGIATTDLSGVRLAARDHLPAMLESIASAPLVDRSAPISPRTASVDAAELSSRSSWVGAPDAEPEAPQGKTPIPVNELSDAPADRPQTDKEPPQGDCPNDLLTSEELTALLEDK